MNINTSQLLQEAQRILQINDKGHYTVPTHGLYPFQWNWDSCLTALGQQAFDAQRPWREIETLLTHQWPDGMVPHIIFHEKDEGYFPGACVWDTQRPTPTSGITQPPVLAMVLETLWQRSDQSDSIRDKCIALIHKTNHWHEWFYRCRDPQNTGLVALLHPWESGRDNSIDWIDALSDVPIDNIQPYTRRDTQHVDASHRPTMFEYDRYIALVQCFRELKWDNTKLHDASPFQVVDPGFNAILIASDKALARLAMQLMQPQIAERANERSNKALKSLPALFDPTYGQYLCLNRKTNQFINSCSVGGLLPVLVLSSQSSEIGSLVTRLNQSLDKAPFGVASHDINDPRFDANRYWRGPSWLIINYLLIKGLRQADQTQLAQRIEKASLKTISKSGCSEYYNPTTGEALGGGTFTWTAAMVIEFLKHPSV